MNEVEITREDFERLWGCVPPGDAVGVTMFGAPTGGLPSPIAKYHFVGKAQEEISELEKLARTEQG